MDIVVISEGRRKARKFHQCYNCCRSIEIGEIYEYQTNKGEEVYTLKFHPDCLEASNYYYDTVELNPWDFSDGGYPPLYDIFIEDGEFQHCIDMLRGRYPHVSCRLELSKQLFDIRYLDRCRASGFDPM